MKKLTIASLTFLFVLGVTQFIARSETNSGAMAKETNIAARYPNSAGMVHSKTAKRFNELFGNVSGQVWEKSKSLDKVTFQKDGNTMVAYYNAASRLVGTGSADTYGGMPGHAVSDLKTRYKDYAVGSVIFYDKQETNATSKLIYGTRLKEENYLIELINENSKIVVMVTIKGEKAVIHQI